MFRIPEELELELQKKFPNVPIRQIIQSTFQSILNKTLMMGHVL